MSNKTKKIIDLVCYY